MESTQRGYMLTKQTSFLNSYYNNVKVELVSAVQRVLQGKRYITPTVAEKMASSLDDKQPKELHHQLSDREFSVFKMLSSGKSITEIADALYLSATTVSS
jgi:two-component system invasion response regulator UvrY